MSDNSSPVKVYKDLIKKAKKLIGPTKDYPHLSHFANTAFRELLEKEGKKSNV